MKGLVPKLDAVFHGLADNEIECKLFALIKLYLIWSMFFVHLCSSLYQDIIDDITSNRLSDEVHAIFNRAFSCFDKEVKQSLVALAPSILMSKRYCNAKSCVVVALFSHNVV